MSKKIGIDQIGDAIQSELTVYSQDVTDRIKKQANTSIKKLVKQTQTTAPVDRGIYKASISSKKLRENERGVTWQWFVKGSAYRLSHLLEYGHAKRNGGRTKAYGFIGRASKPILEEYEKAVKEIVEDG